MSELNQAQAAILENSRRIILLETRMDTLDHSSDRRIKILTKIMSRITVDEQCECWLWEGPTSGNGRGGGYGRMCLDGQTVAVHRVMATLFMGYIPGKKQIDHKCRNRLCVNPDHLEIVTHKENQRRRDAERNERGCIAPIQGEYI